MNAFTQLVTIQASTWSKARNVAKFKEKTEKKKGGYDALYKGKMIDKNLRNELLKRAEEKQKEERVKKIRISKGLY